MSVYNSWSSTSDIVRLLLEKDHIGDRTRVALGRPGLEAGQEAGLGRLCGPRERWCGLNLGGGSRGDGKQEGSDTVGMEMGTGDERARSKTVPEFLVKSFLVQ